MKKSLVVLVVVAVVVTGVPILISASGMASCANCGPAVLVGPSCAVAILAAGVALLLARHVQRLRSHTEVVRLLLHSFLLERPPRFA